MRIHFPGKHARQFETPDAFLEIAGIAADLGEAGFVALGLDEFKVLRRLAQAVRDLVELPDRRLEPGAFATELLRLLRTVPDRRVAELAT